MRTVTMGASLQIRPQSLTDQALRLVLRQAPDPSALPITGSRSPRVVHEVLLQRGLRRRVDVRQGRIQRGLHRQG